ncbi:GL24621 [Drosophila persimilis]|uniref:GL24621 n=1 Tax=Drosophila persimilis TaxID=7234 RepID=B4H5T9_DROPE|nr:GL24621 [Drosophila persimilis]
MTSKKTKPIPKYRKPGNLEFVREDDYVEYFIFPKLPDNLTDEFQVKEKLLRIKTEIMEIVRELVVQRSYIWHKDEFQLQVRTGSTLERLLNDETNVAEDDEDGDLPPHLHGVTHYGDNIGDEWFIVYLLLEISQARGEYIARVCDSDGEFVLIEAADVLPDWASPDTCEQRAYIVNGALQLLQNSASTNPDKPMPVPIALQRIRLNPNLYRCSTDVQNVLKTRLKEFLIAMPHYSIHRQIVEVPHSAAQLLKTRPQLVASAVRAFCDRDTEDIKALRTMKFFPPEASRVRTNVRFTRCLYAMVMHNQYTPERRLGWKIADEVSQPELHKEQILGVKLACGLEILATQAQRAGDCALEDQPAWRAYLRSLEGKGYFRDNIEGSAEHTRLLARPRNFLDQQSNFEGIEHAGCEAPDLDSDDDEPALRQPKASTSQGSQLRKNQSMRKACNRNSLIQSEEADSTHVRNFLDFVIPEDNWDSNSEMSDYADDDDIERNFDALSSSSTGFPLDRSIQAYMKKMDRELSQTTIGKSFQGKKAATQADEDDFDDIEDFEPININVNTLKNMMDSYKSQAGGAGPVSNLLSAMGVGMSAAAAAAAAPEDDANDLSESAV